MKIPAFLMLGVVLILVTLGFIVSRPSITKSDFEIKPLLTPILSPTPKLQSKPSAGVPYPSQVFNLDNWKITLPIGDAKKPTEVKQPTLASYKIDPWFIVASEGNGIRFRAPVNGVTTGGSSYPRSELREMASDGKTNAKWSTNSGTHTMFLDEAITAVPKTKQHVVAGQIHNASDDVIVIRLEYPKLYVNVDGKNVATIDSNYTLGKRFKVKFVAHDNKTDVYYNGDTKPIFTLNKNYSGAYFKAGAYTQSNCLKEGSPKLCNAENFGEVVIYQANITHN